MGEMAEAMLEGLLCEQCGALIDGEQPGYPRKCADCRKEIDGDDKPVPA